MALVGPSNEHDGSYGFYPVDQEQLVSTQFEYPGVVPSYLFNQQPALTKSISSEYNPSSFGAVSHEVYSNWTSIPEDTTGYIFDSQIHPDAYFPGYSMDQISSLYLAGYPAVTYDLGLGLEDPSSIPYQYQTSRTYFSPSGTPSGELFYHDLTRLEFAHYSDFPESMSSSPSEDSLSPRSNRDSWQETQSFYTEPSDEQEEEPLQGLGLYDCPDLAMDDFDGDFNPRRLCLGKGLKLEESFKLDDDECMDEEDDWENTSQPASQGSFGLVPWPHATFSSV